MSHRRKHSSTRRDYDNFVRGYTISEAHQRVQEALDDLGHNRIDPEEAMAVLHEYDVLHARTRTRR